MPARTPYRGPTSRRSGWIAFCLAATLGASPLAASASSASASAASAPVIRLTAAQVRALSKQLTVGVSADGTAAERATAAASAAAPLAKESSAEQNAASSSSTSKSSTSTSNPQQDPYSSAETITETNQIETPTGLSLTGTLPGSSSWYRVDTSGQVALVTGSGQPSWTRTEQSLIADWGLKGSSSYLTIPPQLSMSAGYDPVSPATQVSDDTFAVGDFGGGDGGADIAVAYSVGLNAAFPFTLPDSPLTGEASFVTVLSGRDGHTLWHGVYPGTVTQLVAANGGLLVGDETGPDWSVNPDSVQGDSRSDLSFLTFHATGHTAAATTRWTYTDNVPWARWSSVVSTSFGVAAAWTDTPVGLGDPRPADGHVILLNSATGKLQFDTATPGYPRILVDDAVHGRIVAAEETDPTDQVSWQLTAFNPRGGARSVLATRDGTLPTTLAVGDGDRGAPAYYATDLGFDADGNATGSTALAFAASGAVDWATSVPDEFTGDVPVAGGAVIAPQHHSSLIIATQDPRVDTEDNPDGPDDTQLMSLDSRTGAVSWDHQGAVATGLVPALQGDTVLSVAADDTAYRYRITDGSAEGVEPLMGDLYTGVQAAVRGGDGRSAKDLIVGGQSRGVFALDGTPTTGGTPHYLWTATVQGSVHQIESVDGGQEVLVSSSGGWDLIDVRTGRVLTAVATPGVLTWTATAVQTKSGLEIIVPTTSLTAYAPSGNVLWRYTPAGDTVRFADAVSDANGQVISEYGTGYGDASPSYAAVAIKAATGRLAWSQTPSGATGGADLLGAVYASPDIPGDSGDAVAFAWQGRPFGTDVELRDAKTGALLSTYSDGGSFTHIGFSAAPGVGLVQTHFAELSTLGTDETWTDLNTFPNNFDGSFATSADGSAVFLTAGPGIEAYAPSQLFDTDDDYPTQFGDTPAIDDSQQFTVEGSTVLGFQQDETLWDLNWSWNGGGYYNPDLSIHGVTVNQIGTPTAASTPGGKTSAKRAIGENAAVHADRGMTIGDPVSGTGWGDGRVHDDAVLTPTGEESGPDFGGSDSIPGYVPAQLEANLDLTGSGAGQTVAIVDAYDHPLIETELNGFSKQFGLTQTCDTVAAGTPCVDFTVDQMPDMQPQSDNWDMETALDVEWVHAVAPQAKIVLVEAAASDNADMYRAVDAAAALDPAAISMSWGGGGEFSGQDFYNGHCETATTVCVEAAGDDGNPVGYGATAPDVLSIGGTSEQLDASGNLESQSAWSGTGGGISFFEPRPAYQDGFETSAYRGAPDVSALADPQTGVAVYYAYSATGAEWIEVGGTSLATPIWAAILAAADQDRAAAGLGHLDAADGSVFRAVYGLGTHLLDVTSGSNGPCPAAECTARTGYDTVTGLGSPGPGVDAALVRQ
ncbi:PQQ-binding-like beta-propeller repeat protein [Actinospica durhamensis]|uniref:PQQ-binding-like beta-propeller repeat protein n=1 Tax=Actinospica durhamensis TaxID=1508375 RepID=A0A941EQF3_9ACTN|nr:PQQ-binding-like beta-propeller repeat protein [Actinospica durhamensis]MBR7833244.1 PQQ-binding-like beta-propeller repeat protein [Actinospica durhamensis]